VIATALITTAHLFAASAAKDEAVQRFLSLPDPTPTQVRALRHLEAHNEKFESAAWMDVWTESDRHGFRYDVICEGGSEYIRSHVLQAALKSEVELWRAGTAERAGFTSENYQFDEVTEHPDGLLSIAVKPRKKDVLFIEGAIFVSPEDGDLVRLEGRMSKAPSFWTRRVDIVRWFRRVDGFRMPVAVESVANVLVAGRSTFHMSYDYESINGQHVGDPQPQRRLTQLR